MTNGYLMKINGLFRTQEQVFTIYIFGRGLISRIYKEFKNKKKIKQLYQKKWCNEMNTQFSRDKTQMAKRKMFGLTSNQ